MSKNVKILLISVAGVILVTEVIPPEALAIVGAIVVVVWFAWAAFKSGMDRAAAEQELAERWRERQRRR